MYTKDQIPQHNAGQRNSSYEDVTFNSLTIGFEYELSKSCCKNSVDNQWKALKEENIPDTNHKVKLDYEKKTVYEFVSEPYNYTDISTYPENLTDAIGHIYTTTPSNDGTLQVSFGIKLNEMWKLFHLISALHSKNIIKTMLSNYNWDMIKQDSKNWVNKYISAKLNSVKQASNKQPQQQLLQQQQQKDAEEQEEEEEVPVGDQVEEVPVGDQVECNTPLYGMYCLLFHYIEAFQGYGKFDSNTGMKGIPLLMLRNRFCDVYNLLEYDERQQFNRLRDNIPEELNLTLNYLAYNHDLGNYPISVKNWMNTIIDPDKLTEYLVPYNTRIDDYIKNFNKKKFKQDIKKRLINEFVKNNLSEIPLLDIQKKAEEQADQKVNYYIEELRSVKKSIYDGSDFQANFETKSSEEGGVSTYYEKYVNLPDQPQPNTPQGSGFNNGLKSK